MPFLSGSLADYQARHLASLGSHLVSRQSQSISPEPSIYGSSSQETRHIGN
jgi:hypothetical protein